MGKFNALLDALGVVGKEAKLVEKVPYKLKNKEGVIELISPKAHGILEQRDLDTIENLDPEMIQFLGENPAYLEHLKTDKGYGSKTLKKLEEKAKKMGIDSIYLNASPLGTRGLSQEEAAQKLKEFYESQGYNVAQGMNTNTMMYKKLMAGGLAGANILPTTEQQLNPFARLSDVAGAWETAKEKVSKPLAKSLNLSGNPQDEAAFNQILKTGLDPLNFLPGAAGLAAGAAQMFTPSDEERAKKEAEDEMRKRVLNQMAGQ